MARPRTCPCCHVILGIVDGFVFDSNLTLKCSACGKVVFPSVVHPMDVGVLHNDFRDNVGGVDENDFT